MENKIVFFSGESFLGENSQVGTYGKKMIVIDWDQTRLNNIGDTKTKILKFLIDWKVPFISYINIFTMEKCIDFELNNSGMLHTITDIPDQIKSQINHLCARAI